jgi:thioredoxin-like negative regulator of GroEL
VDIYKVNVDEEEALAQLFKVRSIPTLVYIPMNETPIVQAGGKSKAELKELINSLLLKQ